jgi:hypothetical protein
MEGQTAAWCGTTTAVLVFCVVRHGVFFRPDVPALQKHLILGNISSPLFSWRRSEKWRRNVHLLALFFLFFD